MLVHGWKSLAPSLSVRMPRSPLLGLFAVGTLLACSDAEYRLIAPAPECTVSAQAELRQAGGCACAGSGVELAEFANDGGAVGQRRG